MLTVQGWLQNSCQNQILILPDGTNIDLTINYIPQQYGWFIQSLVYQDFILTNVRIVTSPNILQQFKNQIPFGLSCFTVDGLDPTQQEDMNSGYATLFILSQDEVDEYQDILDGG